MNLGHVAKNNITVIQLTPHIQRDYDSQFKDNSVCKVMDLCSLYDFLGWQLWSTLSPLSRSSLLLNLIPPSG